MRIRDLIKAVIVIALFIIAFTAFMLFSFAISNGVPKNELVTETQYIGITLFIFVLFIYLAIKVK